MSDLSHSFAKIVCSPKYIVSISHRMNTHFTGYNSYASSNVSNIWLCKTTSNWSSV